MSGTSLKIPAQVFRWFEKMKNHYDQNIQNVLEKFKEQSEKQQQRIDKTQQNYIDDLKKTHQQQLAQSQQIIDDLKNEVAYFKSQLSLQQQSIEQLNTRYDAVMTCVLKEQSKQHNIKDIFAIDDFLSAEESPPIVEKTLSTNENNDDVIVHAEENNTTTSTKPLSSDEIVEQAITHRQSGATEKAFALFLRAAELNNVKAMAAIGRAYFLAEGVEENHLQGLIWLIKAANKDHIPAQKRVKYFQDNEPMLYQQAQAILAENKTLAAKNKQAQEPIAS